jgi:hypothetical protein
MPGSWTLGDYDGPQTHGLSPDLVTDLLAG